MVLLKHKRRLLDINSETCVDSIGRLGLDLGTDHVLASGGGPRRLRVVHTVSHLLTQQDTLTLRHCNSGVVSLGRSVRLMDRVLRVHATLVLIWDFELVCAIHFDFSHTAFLRSLDILLVRIGLAIDVNLIIRHGRVFIVHHSTHMNNTCFDSRGLTLRFLLVTIRVHDSCLSSKLHSNRS